MPQVKPKPRPISTEAIMDVLKNLERRIVTLECREKLLIKKIDVMDAMILVVREIANVRKNYWWN